MAIKDSSKDIYVPGMGKVVLVRGYFPVNGASDPVAASRNGPGWSVIHVATGRYRVVFNKRYKGYGSADCGLQMTTPNGATALPGPVVLADTNHANKTTFEIFTFVSGSAADIAAAAGTNVQFNIDLWDGRRTPAYG